MTALVRLTAGLIWWVVAFSALYGLHGVGCAAGWDARQTGVGDLQRVALVALWLACCAVAAILVRMLRGSGESTLDRVTVALAVAGLVATVVTGLPIVTAPSCI